MRLPDTLHELLELACDDMEKIIELNKKSDIPVFEFKMIEWLREKTNMTCVGCMAGAVLFQTFGIREHDDMEKLFFVNKDIADKLQAIDGLRVGEFRNAWKDLYDECYYPPLSDDLKKFRDLLNNYHSDSSEIPKAPQLHIPLYRKIAKSLKKWEEEGGRDNEKI